MGKYLITGEAGSGKTTVIQELQGRGYAAYNTDTLPDVTRLVDLQSGKLVDEWPQRPVDWSRYDWKWLEPGLKKLLNSADTVFIGAVVGNQEEFYPLFDKVLALIVDSETLKHRLLTLREHDYGKHPDELAGILASHAAREAGFMAKGALPIDSTQPLETVVETILAECHDSR
jgi:broad-specificity NMP kinase